MEELIRRIGRTKAFLDNGLCRIGPKLDPGSKAAALLTGGASRAVVLADAMVQLCRHDHPSEAVPLLWVLVETAALMRRVADSPEAEILAADALRAMREAPPMPPAGEQVLRLASDAGLPKALLQDVLSLQGASSAAGRTMLPWTHMFPDNRHSGADPSVVLGAAAELLKEVVRTLGGRWPKAFAALESAEG